jgi:hypothetical protein
MRPRSRRLGPCILIERHESMRRSRLIFPRPAGRPSNLGFWCIIWKGPAAMVDPALVIDYTVCTVILTRYGARTRQKLEISFHLRGGSRMGSRRRTGTISSAVLVRTQAARWAHSLDRGRFAGEDAPRSFSCAANLPEFDCTAAACHRA